MNSDILNKLNILNNTIKQHEEQLDELKKNIKNHMMTEIGACRIMSVNHIHGNKVDGKYFNIYKSEIGISTTTKTIATQYRDGKEIWCGCVVIWTTVNGGSNGDSHGRRDPVNCSSPGDWKTGDYILLSFLPKLDKTSYLNTPFPHCVIDNFLDTNIANILYKNINTLKLETANNKFICKSSKTQYNKFGFSNIELLPLALKNILIFLNSKEFINQIEQLTGISGIVYGDYKLRGAGVHIIKNNGFLNMHTDFNTYKHPEHGNLDRRINLLLYMNKDWKSEYKGDLLMYSPDNTSYIKRIEPLFNRCILFNTTNKSIHGHPEPLCVPDDNIYRKSIAVYYYTKNKNGKVDFEGDRCHSTIFYNTPNL